MFHYTVLSAANAPPSPGHRGSEASWRAPLSQRSASAPTAAVLQPTAPQRPAAAPPVPRRTASWTAELHAARGPQGGWAATGNSWDDGTDRRTFSAGGFEHTEYGGVTSHLRFRSWASVRLYWTRQLCRLSASDAASHLVQVVCWYACVDVLEAGAVAGSTFPRVR